MTSLAERLVAAAREDEVVALAAELVRRASPNPPGDERDVAAWVEEHVRALGCHEVEIVEPAPRRRSVVARFGRKGGRVLAWNGHLDVVPVGDEAEWTHAPFGGEVAEGRLWGRGSVDMKGGVACALAALQIIRRAGLQLEGEVLLLIAADEETGGEAGTAHLVDAGYAAGVDAAICGEATELDVVVSAKGLMWVEIAIRGRSSHASQPQRGCNAVALAGDVLSALAAWRSSREHPLLGGGTLVPTIIQGGIKANIVPDECRVTVDRRLLPGEQPEDAIAEIESLLADVRRGRDAEITVRSLSAWEPSEIPADSEIVVAAQEATAETIGRRAQVAGTTGATDARHLINSGGVPTVIFGPGRIDEAHTVDEWISVEQLRLGAIAYAATFCRFLGATESS